MDKTTALKIARASVSKPFVGINTSWTFTSSWKGIDGPHTETRCDSYSTALKCRKETIVEIAAELMGIDKEIYLSVLYRDDGFSSAQTLLDDTIAANSA